MMPQMHCLQKRLGENLLMVLVMEMHIWLAVHRSKEAVRSTRIEARVESGILVVQAETETLVESKVPEMSSVTIAIRRTITRRIVTVS